MIKLTILTPTYNRSKEILNCYDSLCKQTIKDFQWLIIDDGSIDDTEDIIKCFSVVNNGFYIDYKRKENGGKHTALNYAHAYIQGEFLLILDSDDYLLPNAVELVLDKIKKYEDDKNIGCISFRRGFSEDAVIGKVELREDVRGTYISYRVNENIWGDQCEVIRTELLKKYLFPIIKKERFLGEDYLWIHLAKEYDTIYINKIIYICEYLVGGLTRTGRKLQIDNPKGAMIRAELYQSNDFLYKYRLKGMILYICYLLFAKERILLHFKKTPYKALFGITFPIGVGLYFYWKYKFVNKSKVS